MTAVTATPKSIRPHIQVVEVENAEGYRQWSAPLHDSVALNSFLFMEESQGRYVSDVSCSYECWCQSEA